jgi:hypothetical protein
MQKILFGMDLHTGGGGLLETLWELEAETLAENILEN